MSNKDKHFHDGEQKCCECGDSRHCCCDCPTFRDIEAEGLTKEQASDILKGRPWVKVYND